ncbi:hypothetical protein GCM10027269_77180 [Kribbella endophytica]
MLDVRLVLVVLGNHPERVAQRLLRVAQQAEIAREMHQSSLLTRTADHLKVGCFDTGSHSVNVNSLAAVGSTALP